MNTNGNAQNSQLPPDIRKVIDEVTKKLIDEGKLLEAGFAALRIVGIPENASDAQVRDMRNSYFAGAQHLFASLMSVLEAGQEATEKDLERVTLIFRELEAFTKSLREGTA